ncbi:hypothetical protein CBR_g19438 [Chara braunii]|uniref:UBC core domain-containing protein n=1 Tax=Chara braunii TaxID=69332 RepID=A0A388KXZ2_CHABU|nr:hypothetical protein CBR_g19438 [Chara braunii]|eukprot:GBG74924.1 hypothetical protein CBR_g19438 [Chara braunii]
MNQSSAMLSPSKRMTDGGSDRLKHGGAVVESPHTSPPKPHQYSPYFRETALIIEYKNLKYHAPSGVYVMPSFHSLYLWNGVIFVRQGSYRGGIFKFILQIPDTYPSERPRLFFTSYVFHPRVYPSGELDLSQAFPTWSAPKDYIVHVLTYVQKIFYTIETNSPANPVAAAMFLNVQDQFLKEVEKCVEQSDAAGLHNEPGVSLRFSEYTEAHEAVRQRILRGEVCRDSQGRLLWDVDKMRGPEMLPAESPRSPRRTTGSRGAELSGSSSSNTSSLGFPDGNSTRS